VTSGGLKREKVTFRSLYTISGGPFLGPAKTPEDFLRVSLKRSTFRTLFSSKNDFLGEKVISEGLKKWLLGGLKSDLLGGLKSDF